MEKIFNSLGDCKRHVGQLFAQKDEKFQKDETMKVPEKWQKVVKQKGEYTVLEENEKCVCYFYFKTEGNFAQPNILHKWLCPEGDNPETGAIFSAHILPIWI